MERPLPESPKRVNTILTHFLRLPTPRGIGRRETTAQRDAAACTRSGAKSVRTDRSSPVADRENFAPASISMVSAEAWGEASVMAQPRRRRRSWRGSSRSCRCRTGCGCGCRCRRSGCRCCCSSCRPSLLLWRVAVAVAVGVGVGDPPAHSRKYVDPAPSIHVVWGACCATLGGRNKTAALFKASRLASIWCLQAWESPTTTAPWRRKYAEWPWTCRWQSYMHYHRCWSTSACWCPEQ